MDIFLTALPRPVQIAQNFQRPFGLSVTICPIVIHRD